MLRAEITKSGIISEVPLSRNAVAKIVLIRTLLKILAHANVFCGFPKKRCAVLKRREGNKRMKKKS
jgi:hypothetical protein